MELLGEDVRDKGMLKAVQGVFPRNNDSGIK
jgi:hypothetical protein